MRGTCVVWSVVAVDLCACSLIVDTSGLHEDQPTRLDAGVDGALDATSADGTAATCGENDAWTVGDHCYFLLGKDTQPLAKAACVAVQAHLVTVTSAAEHEAMVVHTSRDAWIGLEAPPGTNDTAAFSWITGEPKTVDYWAIADERTGCVVFAADQRRWADRPCTDSYLALCERP
jgi:hypothetical protein